MKTTSNYSKNYDHWNSRKKELDLRVLPDDFFFLEGEVWWAMLGINIGHEIDGKNDLFERPILIFKKQSEDMLFALPITSKSETGQQFYTLRYRDRNSTVLLNQPRSISSKRLLRLIYRISNRDFQIIHTKIHQALTPIKTIPSD